MLGSLLLAGGERHLSAASGVVRLGDRLYVVADDEPALAAFDVGRRPLEGELVALDETELPSAHAERKAVKPDLESLCLLPDDALLTLGSGATDRRERGWVLPLGGARRRRSRSAACTQPSVRSSPT